MTTRLSAWADGRSAARAIDGDRRHPAAAVPGLGTPAAALAGGVALATGDALALGAPVDCPGRRLALVDGDTEAGAIVIE